jgi:hypothetical protein
VPSTTCSKTEPYGELHSGDSIFGALLFSTASDPKDSRRS